MGKFVEHGSVITYVASDKNSLEPFGKLAT